MSGKKGSDKRAIISPLVATALIAFIALAVVTSLFFWVRGISEQSIEKFGAPIEDACSKVSMNVEFSGEEILVENTGEIPIHAINLEIVKDGKEIKRFLRPNDGLVDTAETDSVTASVQDISGKIESVVAIPAILGKGATDGETKIHSCSEQSKVLI